mmetsp:Transcript_57004/g.135380  ORF Transcript_57004/g.135380 Transcript_57004/m.135380 type:complete len:253 (+) Transcript_57004:209-967(+)
MRRGGHRVSHGQARRRRHRGPGDRGRQSLVPRRVGRRSDCPAAAPEAHRRVRGAGRDPVREGRGRLPPDEPRVACCARAGAACQAVHSRGRHGYSAPIRRACRRRDSHGGGPEQHRRDPCRAAPPPGARDGAGGAHAHGPPRSSPRDLRGGYPRGMRGRPQPHQGRVDQRRRSRDRRGDQRGARRDEKGRSPVGRGHRVCSRGRTRLQDHPRPRWRRPHDGGDAAREHARPRRVPPRPVPRPPPPPRLPARL